MFFWLNKPEPGGGWANSWASTQTRIFKHMHGGWGAALHRRTDTGNNTATTLQNNLQPKYLWFFCVWQCVMAFFFPKINFWLKYSQTDGNNTALQCFAYPLFPIIPNWLLQRAGREKTSSLTTVHIQHRKFREVIYVYISKIHVWTNKTLTIY